MSYPYSEDEQKIFPEDNFPNTQTALHTNMQTDKTQQHMHFTNQESARTTGHNTNTWDTNIWLTSRQLQHSTPATQKNLQYGPPATTTHPRQSRVQSAMRQKVVKQNKSPVRWYAHKKMHPSRTTSTLEPPRSRHAASSLGFFKDYDEAVERCTALIRLGLLKKII